MVLPPARLLFVPCGLEPESLLHGLTLDTQVMHAMAELTLLFRRLGSWELLDHRPLFRGALIMEALANQRANQLS